MIVQLAATLVTQATRNATTSMDRFVAYANTVTRKYQTRRNANVRKYTLSFVLKLINRNQPKRSYDNQFVNLHCRYVLRYVVNHQYENRGLSILTLFVKSLL